MPEGVLECLGRGDLRGVVVWVVADTRRQVLERRELGAGIEEEVGRAHPGVLWDRRDAESVLTAELAARSHVGNVAGGTDRARLNLECELAHLMVAHRAEQQYRVSWRTRIGMRRE